MDNKSTLYKDFYEACLFASRTLGEDIKHMSWFGHWKQRSTETKQQQAKEAA